MKNSPHVLSKVFPHSQSLHHLLPIDTFLGDEDVHVWHLNLLGAWCVPEFCKILAADELVKADQFRFDRDRNSYIIIRGILRVMIGDYLGMDPAGVRLSYGAHGKPTVTRSTLQFNLSHSGDIAFFAFSRKWSVGIDVEKIRSTFDFQKIVDRFFSPKERALINALPNDKRCEAFFSIWTRKEAYIKGRGVISSDRFCIDDKSSRWMFKELNPIPGYVATIAVEGSGWQLSCFDGAVFV